MRALHLLPLALQLSLPGTTVGTRAFPGGSTSRSEPQLDDRGLLDGNEFDYIVVGGGTAGAAIATRLAEDSFKVALIEAGGHYELESLAAIPAAAFFPIGTDPETNFPIDWHFVTEEQRGANNRELHYARGKCLGGSSALNFMLYQRPTKESMDEWATAVDDDSYHFDNLLPYYKKSVQLTPPNEEERLPNATASYEPEAYDSDGGPLQVSFPDYPTPWSTWVRPGLEAIGIKAADGFSMGSLMGAQYCPMTIRPDTKTRSSSESSFLATNKSPTLVTFAQTIAKKILFDDQKKATGVEVKRALLPSFTLKAKKEVILSAGAFQSPQLLMVSGIGPADTLREHDIEVLSDLPGVGQNMWDHPFTAVSYRVNVQTVTKIAADLIYLATQLVNDVVFKDGPFTNQAADYLAWEKLPDDIRSEFSQKVKDDLSQFPSDWPEIEYISAAGYLGNLSDPFGDQPKDGYQYASIIATIVSPTSRGNITIKSANAEDAPVINPNWLTTQTDKQLALGMVKRIRQAFGSDAMKPVLIGDEYYPGSDVESDEQILEFIRNNITPIWHPACTCKMGTSEDPMAVVDSQAKVFGVQGLRVVDASAFALLPPGHPQATVYMLAEKIADVIKNGA